MDLHWRDLIKLGADARHLSAGRAGATINAWNLLNVGFRNPVPEAV